MQMRNWLRIYREIERDFGFSRQKEIVARNTLSELLGMRFVTQDELSELIKKEVYVVGNSPSLENEIYLIPSDGFVIAADDAAVVLYKNGIVPDIVLTDLDGDIGAMLAMPERVIFGIHAHGDNLHLLHYVKKFRRRFGTTQIEPLWNVYNFGGFTDGDRCVFLAYHFGAKIHLIGFDFGNPRIKTGKNVALKKKKLYWANRLINMLKDEGACIIQESLNL